MVDGGEYIVEASWAAMSGIIGKVCIRYHIYSI